MIDLIKAINIQIQLNHNEFPKTTNIDCIQMSMTGKKIHQTN